jgi:hypothetical protein
VFRNGGQLSSEGIRILVMASILETPYCLWLFLLASTGLFIYQLCCGEGSGLEPLIAEAILLHLNFFTSKLGTLLDRIVSIKFVFDDTGV